MMGRLKKLTEDQVEQSINLYIHGFSLNDIAKRFHVYRQAIWDLLRRRISLRGNKRYGETNHFYRGGPIASDKAQNILEKAVKRGDVQRKEVCEHCGNSPIFKDGRSGIQGHHIDYNKPLNVIWLCQPCHHECHKKHKPILSIETP